MEELVTVQEIADYLKMSPQTIYRFAQQGRIPALKVGNRWRFRPADIESWLQSQDDDETAPSILIIDDEISVGRVFSETLRYEGYRTTVAHSGAEAVEAIKRQRYALIFLDLVMPDMNGLETLKAIRRLDPEVKIVIVTGHQYNALLEEVLRLGPFTVLTKPCDREQIVDTANMLVS